jgi:ribonuclease Z
MVDNNEGNLMRAARCLIAIAGLTAGVLSTVAYGESGVSDTTRIVMLGTGTPITNPARSGPSLAIVVNETPYIVDFGPGVVRRAAAASPEYGGSVKGLEAANLTTAFLTHLHSDHTAGYPDLIFTTWTMGRDQPLTVFGPEGIADMTENILEAYREDIRYRVYGLEPANDKGWRVNTHTVAEGVVYEDDNVKVEAFPVKHGSWPNAFGYRFTTPDRVIVLSGDAARSDAVEAYSKGADVLIHEVYSAQSLAARDNPFWTRYHSDNHTSAAEVGQIAAVAKPKLVILNHILFFGATNDELLAEIRQTYSGKVVIANDLDVF